MFSFLYKFGKAKIKKKGTKYSIRLNRCKKPIEKVNVLVKYAPQTNEVKPTRRNINIDLTKLSISNIFNFGVNFTNVRSATSTSKKSSNRMATDIPGIFKNGNFG